MSEDIMSTIFIMIDSLLELQAITSYGWVEYISIQSASQAIMQREVLPHKNPQNNNNRIAIHTISVFLLEMLHCKGQYHINLSEYPDLRGCFSGQELAEY